MKKGIAITAAAAVLLTAAAETACAAKNVPEASGDSKLAFTTENALYAHGADGDDKDAWCEWQSEHDDELNEVDGHTKYFFLASGANDKEVTLYNAGAADATVGGTVIPAGGEKSFGYEPGKTVDVTFGGDSYKLIFLHSTAEAAIYVNNSDADGMGTDLISFLCADKGNSAKATGAIVGSDGSIDNTAVKKIKGRGNTTWDKSKKPFNITYNDKVSIAGMPKSKKYSLLANYQDDSLARNRILYDLSDAVGMPYASDSRFVDLYMNGIYCGSYQLTQKIEVGSSNVVNDIEENDYLNEDGTVKEDFPFVCEIDPSAGSDDYTVSCDNKTPVTIKSPELSPGDIGYDEVKKYVKAKMNVFIDACTQTSGEKLEKCADIDSLTKIYLINELGKNWDAGVSSLYFTYKQAPDGTYRFYGSPVWDYDNSLGNAVGISGDLKKFGVTDYTEYTGWWCRFKGRKKGSKSSSNIMNNISLNDAVLEAAPKIWFEDFVPALRHFSGEQYSEKINEELLTAKEYYALLEGTAEMNYRSGWLLNTGDWIADHSTLNKASFDYASGAYSVSTEKTKYDDTFKGMYDYCIDWTMSRAAWLSAQMLEDYKASATGGIIGDVNGDSSIDAQDALETLRHSLELSAIPDALLPCADINSDGAVNSVDALAILRYSVGLKDEGSAIGTQL